MSLRSMTGFGRQTIELGGIEHTVELRAVNHRFLDLRLKLPRGLAPHETALRGRIGERLHRGRVDVTISAVGGEAAPPRAVSINWPLAEAVRAAHAELAGKLGVPDACDSALVGGWPGVMTTVADAADDAVDAGPLLDGLDAALDALVQMRRREGQNLAAVIEGLLGAIEAHAAALAVDAPGQAEAWQARFEKRLRETLAAVGREADEGRVLHEVAVFAEKTDIAEELARLDSHVAQARGLLEEGAAGEAVGRRLDFICQEMLRETNTVGSKVQAVAMTRRVVELKGELERLREQIQNVE